MSELGPGYGAANVYTYGTLQEPGIVCLIVGRAPRGIPAVLEGYARFALSARVYPAIVEQGGARVSGLLYTGLTSTELDRLDVYEGAAYKRQAVEVVAGTEPKSAFTYVLRAEYRHLLLPQPWDPERFRREHLKSYLEHIARTARAP